MNVSWIRWYQKFRFFMEFCCGMVKSIYDTFETKILAPKVEVEKRTEVISESEENVCQGSKSRLCPLDEQALKPYKS